MSTVGQLMTRDLSVVQEDASIQEAAQLMSENQIGSLFVEKSGEYTGIMTEADIVKAVAEQSDVSQVKAREAMSSPILAVGKKVSPQYARDLMADRRIRHLAVTDGETIIGIISVRDLLAYFKTVSKEIEPVS